MINFTQRINIFKNFVREQNFEMAQSVLENLFKDKALDKSQVKVYNQELPFEYKVEIGFDLDSFGSIRTTKPHTKEETMQDINWLCSTLGLRPGAPHILSAFSNVGKTFFAMNLALCVANNMKLFDTIKIENPGKVLHIDYEMGQDDVDIYYWRLQNGLNFKEGQLTNVDTVSPNMHLDDPDFEKYLEVILKEYKLCIIDCLTAAIPSVDINDDRTRQYIDLLTRVSLKTDCTILVIHHEPKNANSESIKSVKGSGSIISAAGGSIHCTKIGDEIEVSLGKKRLTKYFSARYTLDDCGNYSERLKMFTGIKLNLVSNIEEEVNSDIEILQLIQNNKAITTSEIKNKISLKDKKIIEILNDLERNKYITVEGQKPKKHFITHEGEVKLSWAALGVKNEG